MEVASRRAAEASPFATRWEPKTTTAPLHGIYIVEPAFARIHTRRRSACADIPEMIRARAALGAIIARRHWWISAPRALSRGSPALRRRALPTKRMGGRNGADRAECGLSGALRSVQATDRRRSATPIVSWMAQKSIKERAPRGHRHAGQRVSGTFAERFLAIELRGACLAAYYPASGDSHGCSAHQPDAVALLRAETAIQCALEREGRIEVYRLSIARPVADPREVGINAKRTALRRD